MKAPTESALVTACLQLLRLRGALAWRNNAAAVPLPDGRGFRRFTGARGGPDIIAVVRGRFVGVECKTATGRQSPAQRAFQAAVEAAGGVYLLCRDVAELDAALDDAARA